VETERGLGGWIKSAAVARVLEKLAPAPDPDVLCVIQQGGSSSEVYLHAFDNEEEVEAYRKGCAEAAYEVSETFKVPESIIAAPGVMDAMEDAAWKFPN
jgi:hypothetical protein